MKCWSHCSTLVAAKNSWMARSALGLDNRVVVVGTERSGV